MNGPKLDYELWKQDLRRATTHAVAGAALAALLFMGSALAFAGIPPTVCWVGGSWR